MFPFRQSDNLLSEAPFLVAAMAAFILDREV